VFVTTEDVSSKIAEATAEKVKVWDLILRMYSICHKALERLMWIEVTTMKHS
jgi:hypothetical protein